MARQARLVLLAAVVLVCAMLSATPAQARSSYYVYRHPVFLTGQKKLGDTGLCVEWRFQGSLRLDVQDNGKANYLYYKNPRVVDPEITVRLYDRCVSSYQDYRVAKSFYGADVRGIIYGANKETCSWNPSISASLPYGLSVSASPHCDGNDKVAKGFQGRFSPGTAVKYVRYVESGWAAKWNDSGSTRYIYDDGWKHYLCWDYRVAWKIYRREGSGAVGISDKSRWWSDCFNIWEATPYA